MRARIDDDLLYLHARDVPPFKRSGSQVRNNYFWALRSIAGHARPEHDWEFEPEIWPALVRMLGSFMASGYLGLRETQLEFAADAEIPPLLRPVATWADLSWDEESD